MQWKETGNSLEYVGCSCASEQRGGSALSATRTLFVPMCTYAKHALFSLLSSESPYNVPLIRGSRYLTWNDVLGADFFPLFSGILE